MIKRIKELQSKLDALNVDAVYLASAVSHRYFTTFDNPDAHLLITKERAYAFEDFRYTEVANNTLAGIYTVLSPRRDFTAQLNEIFAENGIKRLGYENLVMCVERYDYYKSSLNVELVKINDVINKMREIKSNEEIEKIREAQRVTDLAFEHMLKMLTPNMTENDVAAELEYVMRKNGAEDKSFETIAVSGRKSSMPHGVPSSVKLSHGFLTMDFGALYEGYHSDMTRTVSIGKADEEMKKLYNTVLKAQTSALEMLKAGVTGAEADKVARDIIYVDYEGYFGHSLGHGVGLEIHERPNLSYINDKPLVPGNIVTVEPGIYIPNKYGCRIEDMVLITENGIMNFTKSPKEIIEIF